MITTINNILKLDQSPCLSSQARMMLATHRGYRTDAQSIQEYHTGSEIIDYEINELGNLDILDTMNALYSLNLKTSTDVINELNVVLGFDFQCLWLTNNMLDVVELYTDGHKRPTTIKNINVPIDKYYIPNTAILISDVGSDGQLFAVSKEYEWYVDTIWCNPLKWNQAYIITIQ